MTTDIPGSEARPSLLGSDRPLPTGFKIVAVSQVWGAAMGTWAVLQFFMSKVGKNASLPTTVLLLLFLAFYTISGAGALLMLRGRDAGIRWVRLAQIPQFVHLQAPDFIYTLLSGVYVLVYATTGGAGVNFGVISTFTLRSEKVGVAAGIGINVVALAIFLYLSKKDPFRTAERRRYPARAEDQLGAKSTPWSAPLNGRGDR